MATKKYVTLNRLSTFLNNLNKKFAALSHKHTVEDISNYKVDNQLSSTSVNPVQNKVLDAEFEAISEAMQVFDATLDDKSDKTHKHTISDISNLQSTLDGKANSSHGTHVTYSTTNPVMNGAANVGTANTVARSDHSHPTDSSRASQIDLDALETVVDGKANKSHSHSISDITNLQTTLDTKTNQNAFTNIKISNTTIVADTVTDTLTLVAGNNITITPDATNDKITISSTDTNTTYSAGTGISLSGTIFSNSGVRSIATGSSNGTISVNTNGTIENIAVKGLGSAAYTSSSAYDVAGSANNALTSAKTYADNAVNKVKNDLLNGAGGAYDTLKELGDLIDDNADAIDALEVVAAGKANKSHTHAISDITNLQTTLNNKSDSSHTHNNIVSRGNTTAETETTRPSISGISMTQAYNNGYATTYGNILNLKGQGDGQLLIGWSGTSGAHAPVYVRSKRDVAEANWSDWAQVYTTAHKPTATDIGAAASSHTHKVANVSDLTANATELNYVKGVTSGIQTQLDGKAASSHSHSISNVSGLQGALDGKSATSHTHYYAGSSSAGGAANTLAITDTRNVNDTPTEITNLIGGKGARIDFKGTSTVGLSNGTYAAVLSISPWGDTTNWSGGKNTQLGFCDDGRIQVRKGNGSGWSSWNTLIDSSTIGNQSVKYATSSGSSTKATQDASGNVITSTYVTKTELDTAKSNLQTSINGKANSSHTHSISNVTNLQTTLDGKASSSHNHGLLHTDFTKQIDNTTTDSGWSMINSSYNGFLLKSIRTQANAPSWAQGNYAAGVAFGGADTKGIITHAYGSPSITFAGGNGDKPVWWIKATGTSGTTYNLNNMPLATKATQDGNGNNIVNTYTTKTELNNTKSNLQTQLDGKSSTSHTHNYAGSSSAGGSATSAVKLQTARSIALGNDLTGSANFDGSGNITISAKHYNASVNSGNKSNYPYHRFAYRGSKASPITSQYNDTDAIFCIRETYNGGGYGILKVSLRTNASTSTSQASATWLARYNFALDDVKIGLYNVAGATYADLYIKVGTYARTVVYQLEGNRSWTLVSSNEVNDTTTSDKKTSTESYVSIENAATTLHSQAYSSIISSVDGGQVNYANSSGSATTASTCTGNSATATKLSSAKTISLTGDVTGSTSFDGSGNVSITATVADDSHNHIIANIDNLQSVLDGKSATTHTHTADNLIQWADALFGTNSGGGVEFSYGSGSGKNVLTEISNMGQGLHTIYAISGTTGNPKTSESFRYLVHKTSTTIGWILAWDAQGSLFTNYQSAAGTFKGWKCIYDANPSALWTGGYYMSSTNGTPQTVTPSKKLSECRNGWVLIWSDYDPDTSTKNNTDIHHDYVFKKNCAGANWSGQCMLCDIPRYMGSNSQDVDTERRILKAIYIHDDRIEGSYQGSYDERNDVILRAVYEF